MNNRIENNYVSEKQLRQLNQSRVEAKIVVLKAVGYPLESSFMKLPKLKLQTRNYLKYMHKISGVVIKYIKVSIFLIRN